MTRIKILLLCSLILPFTVLIYTEVKAKTPLYKKDAGETQGFIQADEQLLNDITSIRILLMSGEKSLSLDSIKILSGQLAGKNGVRHYDSVGLILVRLKEGRKPRYLYFPPSFEKILNDTSQVRSPSKSVSLIQKAEWDNVVASLDIDFISIQSVLVKAFNATKLGRLEKADNYLQELYSDLISQVSLENDPIQHLKDRLKKAGSLLNQGKTNAAIKILDKSEKLLTEFMNENPDFQYIKDLHKVTQGFDKIRTFNFGKPNEVSRARIKIYNTVSDMRFKLKRAKIKLPY